MVYIITVRAMAERTIRQFEVEAKDLKEAFEKAMAEAPRAKGIQILPEELIAP